MSKIIHLHLHTDASELDGSCEVNRLIEKTKKQGEKAVAITDHGTCLKHYEFYKVATENGIKPILGCEFYCGEEDSKDTFHLIVLAKDNVGLKNMYNLMYLSHKNFYRKPRIKYCDLEKHKEGFIVLSSCLGSETARTFRAGHISRSIDTMKFFKNTFGNDYYLEIQPNSIPIQRDYNLFLEKTAKELGIKVVVTVDSHYINKEDFEKHDTLLCIQTKKKKADEERFKFPSNDFYLKDEEEVIRELDYLRKETITEGINSTYEIADKCNATIEYKDLLPKMPGIEDERKELARLCNEGFKKRMSQGHYNNMNIQEVVDRIKFELSNIIEKGYAGYFLIVEDIFKYCEENNIPTGGGRGSVCGSEVAFVLGITDVEPIKYGLLYERFLNPTRNSPPDVDTDVCYEKRQEVISYIENKYGFENVSHIITEGKMTTKAVIRKVLTVYGYEMSAIKEFTSLVDDRASNLEEAIEMSDKLKAKLLGTRMYEDMTLLEGLISHTSKHAAGILITPEPIYNIYPTRIDREENVVVCEWHKKSVESTGGFKFDFLGLKQLTIFDKTLKFIKQNKGIDIKFKDLYNINLEDENIYKVLNDGALNTIFQFTGDSASAVISKMKPTCFDDIMVAESICRPGVRENELYLSNKKLFNETGSFDKPSYYSHIEDIVGSTMGCIVYQEQTMQILNKIGNFSLGEADGLRKVKSLEPFRERFVTNAITNGLTEFEANELFDRFDLGYSFNKSHACAYGLTSAICCYLYYYYPEEFLSASMTLELTQQKPNINAFLKEVRKLGIKVLPPDINASSNEFLATGDGIRIPLTMVESVGDKACSSVFDKRPYVGFADFLKRVNKSKVGKKVVENLIKSGAFDSFEQNRSLLLTDYYNFRNEDKEVYFWCDEVQMMYENQVFGFTLSKDPLDGYTNKNINEFAEGTIINIVGIIREVRTIKDKNKKDMAFLNIENKECTYSGVVFSYAYPKIKQYLEVGYKLNFVGKKQGTSVLINNVNRI